MQIHTRTPSKKTYQQRRGPRIVTSYNGGGNTRETQLWWNRRTVLCDCRMGGWGGAVSSAKYSRGAELVGAGVRKRRAVPRPPVLVDGPGQFGFEFGFALLAWRVAWGFS